MPIFSQLTLYLTDPLVLVGIVLFFGLLLVKYLMKKKIINHLPAKLDEKLPQAVIANGFVLGLMVIGLGVVLKHSELREAEQENALSQLLTEYEHNMSTLKQLSQNTLTLIESHHDVSASLRAGDSVILNTMFPQDLNPSDPEINISKRVDSSFDTLKSARLFDSQSDMAAFKAAKDQLKPRIIKHYDAMQAFIDLEGDTFWINDNLWQDHIEIYAEIDGFDMSAYEDSLVLMEGLRSQYDLVMNHMNAYLSETKSFMDRNTFIGNGDVYEILTKERLSLKSLNDYDAEIRSKAKELVQMKKKIQSY